MSILNKTTQYSALAILALCAPSIANAGESNVWNLFHGAPKVKSDNGDYWKLRGRVFWDVSSLSETRTNGTVIDIDDNEFRTARIGIEGKINTFKYKAEIDVAGDSLVYKDVNVTWKGPINIALGQMKAGGTMEEITSGRHIAFMERGMTTDAFGFDRRIGVNVSKSGENYGFSAGIFGNSINGLENDKPSNTVIASRGYMNTKLEGGQLLHFGASLRHTDKEAGAPKRSARWGAHLAKEKIKPKIGGDALLYGLEAAAISGAFHGHAEYLHEKGDLGSAKGGFIQAGYFLTGETRKYKGGVFNRTKPSKPISKGGMGGWEVVARFDTLDATNASDEQADAYSIGLTWYPESHLRVKFNYTDASADTFEADGLSMRLQMDW